ncbi:EamA family transporter [Paenibacillus sp. SC116]|uniref:DMT family transporter n=1 Tax=Paenibacillus sp. SC116 TaxID=2968986 RepID=UPI00215A16C4|nr:EamA family transporter [Paenibacillus sp. SC116]MCR8845630.1 EamA family transporter [Paenibacillus sp. SC116]
MIVVNFVLMCIVFGTTFLAIKVGVDAGAPPFFSAGSRFVMAGFLILMWMAWKKKVSFTLLLRKEMWLIGLGLTFGTFSLLYWAEQYVSSGTAAILSATAPIVMILLQTVMYRDRVESRKIVGSFISLAGVVVLVLPQLSLGTDSVWLLGCIAILVGQLFYAGGALYSKKVISRFSDTSPIAQNAAQMLCGGILLLLLSVFSERIHLESLLSLEVIGSQIYLIVIGSMVGHTIFYWLVAHTNPLFPSMWLYISPFIAVGIGSLLYNEVLSIYTIVGAVATIVGIVFVNTELLGGRKKKAFLAKGISSERAAHGQSKG